MHTLRNHRNFFFSNVYSRQPNQKDTVDMVINHENFIDVQPGLHKEFEAWVGNENETVISPDKEEP